MHRIVTGPRAHATSRARHESGTHRIVRRLRRPSDLIRRTASHADAMPPPSSIAPSALRGAGRGRAGTSGEVADAPYAERGSCVRLPVGAHHARACGHARLREASTSPHLPPPSSSHVPRVEVAGDDDVPAGGRERRGRGEGAGGGCACARGGKSRPAGQSSLNKAQHTRHALYGGRARPLASPSPTRARTRWAGPRPADR